MKAGATRYPWRYQPGDEFVVLEDPDGHLFCMVSRKSRPTEGRNC